MPPSFSGGLLCAIAPLAATASPTAKTPERTRFMKPPIRHAALFCGLYFDWLDHAACAWQRQAARRNPVMRWLSVAFSAKRNYRAGVSGRRPADPDRGASADAVIRRVSVDDRLHAEEWQQLAVEFA